MVHDSMADIPGRCDRCGELAKLVYTNGLCDSCDVGERRAKRKDRIRAEDRRRKREAARRHATGGNGNEVA